MVKGSVYVFSSDKGGALDESRLNKAWRLVRARAALPHVQLRDFRATFTTWASELGVSFPIAQAMLGHAGSHRDQRKRAGGNVTLGYMHVGNHLGTNPLRQAANAVSKLLAAALRDEPAEVVEFPGGARA